MKTDINVKICVNTKLCTQNNILVSTIQNIEKKKTSFFAPLTLKRWICNDPKIDLEIERLKRLMVLNERKTILPPLFQEENQQSFLTLALRSHHLQHLHCMFDSDCGLLNIGKPFSGLISPLKFLEKLKMQLGS